MNFGNTNQTTGFGNTTVGFGSLTSATPAKPNTFGTSTIQPSTNLFGSSTTNQTTSAFGATQQQPTTNLFGNNTLGSNTNTGSLFGNTTSNLSNQSSIGLNTGFTAPQTNQTNSLSGFGTQTNAFGATSSSGFNNNNSGSLNSFFGAKPSYSTTLFPIPQTQTNYTFTKPIIQQQIQQQQSQQNEIDPLTFTPKLFNNEHDLILGEFNKLQAYWGFGKGFYAYNKPPTEFNQHQPLHKFKSIGFSEIRHSSDGDENKFGVLIKMQNEEQLNTNILQYEANLKGMFGINFNIKVENCKQLPENKALLCISVVDTNTNKKLPAFQLISYLNQAHIKQQLNNAFLNMFIELVPLQPPSKQEIEEYLKTPTSGIDPALWEQAKKENPDPKKFIPVPFIGFASLNARLKYQVQETEQQRLRLQIISEDIDNLERDNAQIKAKLEECKRRNITLGNRVLKTMIWQEIKRKKGFPILAEEDELRSKLLNIQNELNAPTKYKGCLNELICKLRHMQSQTQKMTKVGVDANFMKEIQAHLNEEQQGIEHLLKLVKNDIKDLKAIKGTLK